MSMDDESLNDLAGKTIDTKEGLREIHYRRLTDACDGDRHRACRILVERLLGHERWPETAVESVARFADRISGRERHTPATLIIETVEAAQQLRSIQ